MNINLRFLSRHYCALLLCVLASLLGSPAPAQSNNDYWQQQQRQQQQQQQQQQQMDRQRQQDMQRQQQQQAERQRMQDQQRQQMQTQQRQQMQDQMRQQQQQQMRQQMQDQQRQQMQTQQRQQLQQQQQTQQRQQMQTQQQNAQRQQLQQQQQNQQRQAQQQTAQQQRAQLQQQGKLGKDGKPTGMVFSGGVAKMNRPLTPGEIQRGYTGKVTTDGRALIKYQGRVFTVPASRVSGLSARLAANQNQQRAAKWTAQQQSAVTQRMKALAVFNESKPRGPSGGAGGNGGSGGGGSGCTPPGSAKCQFNQAATRLGSSQVVYAPALQARIDKAKVAKLEAEQKNVIVDSKGNALVGGWSSTTKLSAPENALKHWNKHSHEFPEYTNAAQYTDAAQSFVKNPPSGTLTKNKGDDELLYDPGSNTFAVRAADGVPRTMFRPLDGIGYWNKQ